MDLAQHGFVTLVGDGIAGLWLAPSRLVVAPRAFVLRLGGSCSFCGRGASEARVLAGALDHDARICGECISLCLAMLRGHDRPAPPSPPARWDDVCAFLQRLSVQAGVDFDESVVSRDSANAGAPRPGACSFCAADKDDVATLIAGPSVLICGGCLVGSATLLRAADEYCLRARPQ